MEGAASAAERAREKIPTAEEIARLTELGTRFRFLEAYQATRHLAPFEQWREPESALVAARLVYYLGAPKLSDRLELAAFRRAPTHPRTRQRVMAWVLNHRGPYHALEYSRGYPISASAPARIRIHTACVRARAFEMLRDFEGARAALDEARTLSAHDAWLDHAECLFLQTQDRYEEALERARGALGKWPDFSPLAQLVGHLLVLRNEDQAALEHLTQYAARTENALIHYQLAELQGELGHYHAQERTLDRIEQLSPLLEPESRESLNSLRSDAAYFSGDKDRGIELLSEAKRPFASRLRERLMKAQSSTKSVRLAVPFIRQHHMTCAPATLSAISRFWGRPADHLGIAEQICYDGTPNHSERNWAEENGWFAREFTVTWASARQVLDAGIPFTLSTVEPTSAHLQAVVGYDEARGTLFFRDPYAHYVVEADAAAFLERYRACGPRGMALVPAECRSLLGSQALEDSAFYDELHACQRALYEHDREKALGALRRLEATDPEHRLTWVARYALSAYDQNDTQMLECAEALSAAYPEDAPAALRALSCMSGVVSRARIRERAEKLVGTHAHPAFVVLLIQQIRGDARTMDRAKRLLRGGLRRSLEPALLIDLGALRWAEGDRAAALELYRWGSLLAASNEGYAWTYFAAARAQGQTGAALAFLRQRFEASLGKSAGPATTLFDALELEYRIDDAFSVLEQAAAAQPENGALKLALARESSRYGRQQDAIRWLELAQDRAHRHDFLRAKAIIAEKTDLGRAIEAWRELVEIDPCAVDAHAALCRQLALSDGYESALEHLAAAVHRFSHHRGLLELHAEWLSWAAPDELEQGLRRIIERVPQSAQAYARLSRLLASRHRPEEARRLAEELLARFPDHALSHALGAELLLQRGDVDAGRAAYRRALMLDPDFTECVHGLLSGSGAEALDDLRAVEELERERSQSGDGLFAWYREARSRLPSEEIGAAIERVIAARPRFMAAHSIRTLQLIAERKLSSALEAATEATRRFPLVARVWFDLANVHAAAGRVEEQRAALEQAALLAPLWTLLVLRLADSHAARGDVAREIELLEKALSRIPDSPDLFVRLGQAFANAGDLDSAVSQVRRALALAPEHDDAWSALLDYSGRRGSLEEAVVLARAEAEKRSFSGAIWLKLSDTYESAGAPRAALEAARRASQNDCWLVQAYDQEAVLLCELGEFETAERACHPEAFGANVPVPLRGRLAWVMHGRGERERAVAMMREVLEAEPSYSWGWSRLSDWAAELGDGALALEAAVGLSRAAPHNAVSHGYLAAALLASGDVEGALDAFRRAVRIDPDYAYATHRMYDLLLERGDLAEAEQVLRVAHPGPSARWVTLKLALGCESAAVEAFATLCEGAHVTSAELEQAREALVLAGLGDEAFSLLQRLLFEQGASEHVGRLWIWSAVRRRALLLPILRSPRGETKAHRSALSEYLDVYVRQGRADLVFWKLLRHGLWMRRRTAGWGGALQALVSAGLPLVAILWSFDFARRVDAEAWMLYNRTVALRKRFLSHWAFPVYERALELEADASTPYHRAFLAYEFALRARTEDASRLFERVPAQLGHNAGAVITLTDCLLEFQRAEPQAVERTFAEVCARLDGLSLSFWSPEAQLRRRARRALARQRRTVSAYTWAYPVRLALVMAVFTFVLWATS